MMAAACGSGQRAIRDVVLVMAMAGLRWGELAGLRVGDRVSVPGPGLRVTACGAATAAAGVPGFRVHDLRHTAASIWLAAGADPKVVQRVLGHACAAMTMDLYGHRVWDGTVSIRGRC
jgi:integrase